MDVPIAIALGAGVLQGTINTVRDAGPIYFDAVSTLILLLLVGRYLQHRAQRTAADAAALLGALAPATARVVDPGTGHVSEIPTEAVVPGMELEVRAGDTLAADGIVLRGDSALDLALLTGESRPVTVHPGAAVFAGTVNLSAALRVRVEQAGADSRLGRLLRDVEQGARERAPVVLFADRMAGWFIAVVLALAATTAALWWSRDSAAAIDNAIALLVVTCPCALAMATPLAFTVAIGRAAARGILIKGGHALESLTGAARSSSTRQGRSPKGGSRSRCGTATTPCARWCSPPSGTRGIRSRRRSRRHGARSTRPRRTTCARRSARASRRGWVRTPCGSAVRPGSWGARCPTTRRAPRCWSRSTVRWSRARGSAIRCAPRRARR